MRVYKLITRPNSYTGVHIVGREYDHFQHLEECSKPMADKWGQPDGERTGFNKLKIADYTSMGGCGMQAVSERVKQLIYDYCRDSAEFLPVKFGDEYMYCLNVTNVLDCIDYEKSSFERFTHSDRIMLFNSYAFVPEKVEGQDMFIPFEEKERAEPFVSQRVVDALKSKRLRGIECVCVWDSEDETVGKELKTFQLY